MCFFFFFPFESASPKGKSVVLCVAFSAEEEARSATSELSGSLLLLFCLRGIIRSALRVDTKHSQVSGSFVLVGSILGEGGGSATQAVCCHEELVQRSFYFFSVNHYVEVTM